ncbi:type IV pilus assembly protein PilM [Patescibacteria group bacterium]
MVGLDIGSKTIKIVELEVKADKITLKSSGVVGYSGVTPDKLGDDKSAATLAQAIKKLHKESGITSKDVSLSIPENHVFTRTIKFPLLTDSEIVSAVKWEADQYIPIPAAEAVIQHVVLERRENATPPEVVVLLVAAPKAIVEKYVNVVGLAGLNTTVVETELMALSRSLSPPGKTVLLVDLGAFSTDIAVCRNGMLSFSRSVAVAGDALTRSVAKGLGVTYQQAEEYKKAYGLGVKKSEGKVKTVIAPVVKMIADEIKKAIHFYQSEDKGDAPNAVIICGGTVGMPALVPYLTELLGMEVAVGNPFAKVALTPQAAKSVAPYAPIYAVAVGLAMREE